MIRELKRPRSFYERLFRLTAPIALQNLITFSLGLIDTLMVSQLGNNEMAAVKTANVPVFLLICTGQKNSASAMTSASPTPSPAATPMARLMF